MDVLSLRLGHDANMAFAENGRIQVVEMERIYGIRHFDWQTRAPEITALGLATFLRKHYGVESFERVLNSDGLPGGDEIARCFGVREASVPIPHHLAHAAGAFYCSEFEEATIFSYDGGGDGCIRYFHGDHTGGVTYCDSDAPLPQCSLGFGYRSVGLAISEIEKVENSVTYRNTGFQLAGKVMGMAGYGIAEKKWMPRFMEYFLGLTTATPFKERISRLTNLGGQSECR